MSVGTAELRPGYVISRVIRGNWQLAGGHGPIDGAAALDDLDAAFDAGLFTLDCADIYTGVEDLIGAFRERLVRTRGAQAAARLKVHTKLVPDLASLGSISKAMIEGIVDRSLSRLKLDRLDLVQVHWWDYDLPGAVQAMVWLDEIRRAGKVHCVGATNFDTPHLGAILEAGVPLVSMQTQYSLLDSRPQNGLAQLCDARDVKLLCYGTVAGGFLSDRWLGAPEPIGPVGEPLADQVQADYRRFWRLEPVPGAPAGVPDGSPTVIATDIATVASRAILDRPGVAAVIVGARDGSHLGRQCPDLGSVRLDDDDRAKLDSRCCVSGPAPTATPIRSSATAVAATVSIMKYDLNSRDHE